MKTSRHDVSAQAIITTLDTGDVWINTTDEQTLIVERKAGDRQHCRNRLFRQIAAMREQTE